MNEAPVPVVDAAPAPETAPAAASPSPPSNARWIAVGAALLAALSAAAVVFAWNTQQRVKALETELVRRQQDSSGQAAEARIAAKAAQEQAREASAKLALLEARVAETTMQRSQLEELIQALARSRDENVLADVDAAIRVALQQTAITGSAEPLLATLRQADERLGRYNQPRLERVRRAIAQDLDRVRAAGVVDLTVLTIRLDEVIRQVDDLPLLSAADKRMGTRVPAPAASAASAGAGLGDRAAAAWELMLSQVWTEVRNLVRVTRIENPDAMLVAPDQAFFLRENLKEIVILRLGMNTRESLTSTGKLHLINTLLRPRFADLLVPRSMGPTVTPDALLQAGKRLIVLVDSWIFADLSGESEVIWNEADDGRGFAGMVMTSELDAEGTGKLSALKNAMNSLVSRAYDEHDRLQLLGCCLTPDDASVIAGVASAWFEPVTAPVLSFWNKVTGQNVSTSTGPKSLHEACAMPATPAAASWLRNEWHNETVNIISTDFFQMSQTVELCIQRNLRPARFYLRSPLNGFVIDLPGGATQPGTRPIMYPRNSPQSTNQQWILGSSGHIRSAANPDMVLDIEGAKTQPGTAVLLWTEHKPAQPNQQWDFDAEGRIRSRLDPRLVLDIKDGNPAQGAQLIVWPAGATASPNQIFARRYV